MNRRLLIAAMALTGFAPVAAQAADGDKPYAGTELTAIYTQMPYMAGLNTLLPEFQEKTGIRVRIETMSEDAASRKARLELATKSATYDIVGVQSGDLPLYAGNGWLHPVQDYLKDGSADATAVALDDFIASTREAMSYGGVQYCLPMFAATQILYYQIDKLKAAGKAAPTTFSELIDTAAAVHKSGMPAIALRGAPANSAGNIWTFNQFFYGEGAKYFANFPTGMTPVVNSPEAIKALEEFVRLKNDYGLEGGVNITYDDVVTALQQARVAMAIDGAPLAGRILDPKQSKVSGNLGFAVIPGGAAGPKPGFNAHGLCITAGSRAPAAAVAFLEWALSKDTMTRIALATNYLATPRNSVWRDDKFRAKYDYNFGGGSFLDAYQKSLEVAPPDFYPPISAWPAVAERMGHAVQQVEIGQSDAKAALDAANEDIKGILKDAGLLK
jgi:ABC-type glycerol-3-phosphate transport system substrate-binding protein